LVNLTAKEKAEIAWNRASNDTERAMAAIEAVTLEPNSNETRMINRRAKRTLFASLLRAARKHGRQTEAIIDADDSRMTYATLLRGAFGLGHAVKRQTKRGERVGVFLPTGAGAILTFFAILAYGRVPAMLNFTAGERNLKIACKVAGIKKILTAHRFIDLVDLHSLVADLEEAAEFVYLEDLKDQLSLMDKVVAVVGPILPWLVRRNANPRDPGVVLFTSGTEGTPKGVVLSHANILANVEQINAHVYLQEGDVIFNPLPTFHCYGLTAGALWPVLTGTPVALHPSPLQVKIIPERIAETRSTILFATDTFLQQYSRSDRKGHLKSLRIAVCGAERVRDETRTLVEKRFGMEVLEGYGVTEAAPVVAANQPGDIRAGTVGKFLPGIEARIEPVEGLDGGAGRLFVRGPNIMLGYLREDNPSEIERPEDGWYDTGDVVSIDEDGYVAIRGRVKRFAKIGGEMVSLTVIENCASAIWPDHQHCAVALPDKRKGEQIYLVSECPEAERSRLLTWMQSHGVSELAVPRRIFHTDAIPVLGTGKTDLGEVQKVAAELLTAAKETAEAAEPEKETVIVEAVNENQARNEAPVLEEETESEVSSEPPTPEKPEAQRSSPEEVGEAEDETQKKAS
jgi:acyl-[acyl-carrier-protein]-phospholipid O-acyltransferase / long-chain-fatty-acid--[acyl-carrier-protein] ligase